METETDPLEELVDSTGNDILDVLLKYGLYLGAIFQLICIFAVIFVPATDNEKVNNILYCTSPLRAIIEGIQIRIAIITAVVL